MISGVSSSYSSLYSATTSTTKVDTQKFQEQLLSSLDTDGDGKVSSDELKTALSSSDSDSPESGVLVSLSQSFSDLDSDGDDGLSLDELSAMAPPAPPEFQQQAAGNTSLASDSSQQIAAQALDKMIANLSKQYQLEQATSVGSQLNVAA